MGKMQRGFSLLEILITIVIMAIGILGVAKLQFISSFSSNDNYQRAQASSVVQQAIERLQAATYSASVNDGLTIDNAYFTAANYNFSNLLCPANSEPFQCHCLTLPSSLTNCQSSRCSAAQMAQYDAHELSCSLVAHMPNGQLSIDCSDVDNSDTDSCSPGSRINVKVFWPHAAWQNKALPTIAQCQNGDGQHYDCVVQELIL